MDARSLSLALVQMKCSPKSKVNIAAAERAIRSAARREVDLCVLPELFTNRYVGQFEDFKSVLSDVPNHRKLLAHFSDVARDTSTTLVVPFAEIAPTKILYNALAVIGNDGSIKAHYRKMHIPDAQGYREDLYFRRGDRGYIVVRLDKIRLGVAICWDQWFPEVSRILALKGAELIVYPSAIGSEIVEPDFDSRPDWELVMRAQAIMNRVFVAAVNRVGQEDRIRFYGGSFVADPWGRIMKRASKTNPQMIYQRVDLSKVHKARSFFGFFETRRPDTYDELTSIRQPTSG